MYVTETEGSSTVERFSGVEKENNVFKEVFITRSLTFCLTFDERSQLRKVKRLRKRSPSFLDVANAG